MTAIRTPSRDAEAIRFEAMRLVDEIEHRRGYPMRHDERQDAWRNCAGHLCHKRMLEELEPINQQLTRLFMLSGPMANTPPEVDALRQSIVIRWNGIAAELLQGKDTA